MTVQLIAPQTINGTQAPAGASVTLPADQEAALLASGAAIATNTAPPPAFAVRPFQ